MTPAVLSVKEAAAYLSLSVRTLYRLSAECGTGPSALRTVHLSPGRRGFRRADLDAYVQRQTVSGGARRTA